MPRENRRPGRPATFDRDRALNVATDLFWRYGFEGTSIAVLTDALGVTPPTLYAAFGSKDELYRACLRNYRKPTGTDGPSASKSERSARVTVHQFLHSMAERFASPDSPAGCMVASGSLRCGAENGSAVAAVAAVRAEGLAGFIELLADAVRTGELAGYVDREGLARFYTAVIQGMSIQAIDGASEAALRSIADLAMAAWPRLEPNA